MSLETLLFLRDLLGNVTVNAGHPDFDEAVAAIGKARRELDAAIAAAPKPNRAARRATTKKAAQSKTKETK